MQTGYFFSVRRRRRCVWLAVLAVWLSTPVPALADAALGMGVLGGALVASLWSSAHHRGQSTLFGTVAGGATPRMDTETMDGARRGYYTVSQPPALLPVHPAEPADCRQMETEGFVDGRQEIVTGVACRNGAGNWQFQDPPRVVRRTALYLDPHPRAQPEAQPVTAYPAPNTVVMEPPPQVVLPSPVHEGRYYGHRDNWREPHYRHLDR
ncbi:MAG: hypothetical protein H7837_10165 [Magnetococcus sp. MYC-9]